MNGATHVLECYQHHISDYTDAAATGGFAIVKIDEWFDDEDPKEIPRLISFLSKLN